MNVKETSAWKTAEWDYCSLQADLQMASLLGARTQEEIVNRLRGMIRRCPQFYPAILDLGLRLLSQKGDPASVRMVEKGFRLMLDLIDPRHFDEEIDGIVENLELNWRFDVSRRLLEELAERRSLSAILHDSLAHAAARLGDLDAAQRHIKEALRLEPDSKDFWSNKGRTRHRYRHSGTDGESNVMSPNPRCHLPAGGFGEPQGHTGSFRKSSTATR